MGFVRIKFVFFYCVMNLFFNFNKCFVCYDKLLKEWCYEC